MKKRTLPGAMASFAHLLGIKPATAKKAEEDMEDKEDDESAEESEDESEDESDEGKDKAKKAKKAKGKKAEDEDDEESAENEDRDGDGDTDEDSDKDEAKKAGRIAERARCKAIFSAAAAGSRPDLAAHLAFNTSLSAKAAVALLDAAATGQPAGSRGNLTSRMSAVKTPNPGLDGGDPPSSDTPKGLAARMVDVYDRATGGK